MNRVRLKGVINNIRFSHKIGDVEYNKADLIVRRKDGKEDIITLEFKKFSNPYTEGQEIECIGNVRSYSKKLPDGKNKVEIFVFTYFDKPTEPDYDYTENAEAILDNNRVVFDGRICKIDEIRTTKDGKQNIHFVVANNIITKNNTQKLNSYIPCIAWGNTAKELSKAAVNDVISIKGEIHSREYKKYISDTDVEIRVAHEVVAIDFKYTVD